jgi:hypothetical protein
MLLASSPSPVKDLRSSRYNNNGVEVVWSASPEKSVRHYIVSYGSPGGPQQRIKVNAPRALLKGVKPGTAVMVKAVNSRGLEGWDWSRVKLAQPVTP